VETLRAWVEDALLYRKLATLRTDVPIEEELEDLRWRGVPPRGQMDSEVTSWIFVRLDRSRFVAV